MAMHETPGSLRAYFIIIALLRGGRAIVTLVEEGVAPAVRMMSVCDLVLALGLFVAGALALRLLKTKPLVLHAAIWLNFGWFLVAYGIALAVGNGTLGLHLQLLVTLAVARYLSLNVARLSESGA